MDKPSEKILAIRRAAIEVKSLKWSPADKTIELIPKQFRLLNARDRPEATVFAIRSIEPGRPPNDLERFWSWKPRGKDKLSVSFSGGLSGFRGTLKRSRDGDLVGKIKEWCDSRCEWKRRTGELRLRRIACSPN